MMFEELKKQLKCMDISSTDKNMLPVSTFTTTEAGAAVTPVTPV